MGGREMAAISSTEIRSIQSLVYKELMQKQVSFPSLAEGNEI